MDPLRIAVALPHLGVYGGIRRFLELGNAWAVRGHEVWLLLPDGARAREPWIPFRGRVGRLAELPTLRAGAFLSPDPALFLSHEAPGALRVFYSVLERAPREREAADRAHLVLANSSGLARRWRRRGVAVVTAAGGVDLERFHPPRPDRRAERSRTGAPVEALVYGRLSRRRKGTWTAVRAVEAASRSAGVPVRLTLFDARTSPADDPAELPRPISVPHRWVRDPGQEELAALYGAADLFVSAERRAGWCNTAAEAMACGAALVCTRSGTEDFARHGDTALVSPLAWWWLLARSAARLLRDPGLRAEIAERGLGGIEAFTWSRTAERIETAIAARLSGAAVGGSRDETNPATAAP
jgi:glycosyltransferase involved in cell wall biosynthesis